MKANRYHPSSIFLHWAIFLLFATALALIEYRGYLPKGDPMKNPLRYWHTLAGQTVLLFVLFRLAARFLFGVPRLVDGPRWQTWSAHTVHALLYILMFALPITGILFNQAAGREINYFGWVLPQFIGPDKELGHTLHDVHEWLGNAVYYVVGLHILGALWHQFVRKDNALRRMWPGGAKG
jgi:cytochrome b561